MASSRLRSIAFTLIKLAVTGALIGWLLSNADFEAIGAMLGRVGAGLFVGAIAAQITGSLFTAVRWWLLLKHTGAHASFWRVLPSYYLGLFFNNLLPTGIGGDVVRTLYLTRRGLGLHALAASMVVDRAIGLLAMLLLATSCAVFFAPPDLNDSARHSALAVLALTLLGAAFALSPSAGRLLQRLQRRYHQTRVRHSVLESAILCYSYRSDPLLLAAATVLSLIAQSFAILAYVLIGVGIGLPLPPATYFVIVPIVFVAAMLPISLGGLGVREGALVGLLLAFGADRQLAIGLSLLYLVVLWLSTLPGAAVLLGGAPEDVWSKPKKD